MVNISELSPGMRVKIVDNWISVNSTYVGRMDRYLGTIGVVKRIVPDEHFLHTKEHIEIEGYNKDCSNIGNYWYWFSDMLDYIVYDDEEDFEPATAEELEVMLFGG